MPQHPQVASSVAGMAGTVYSALAHRLAAFDGETYPLHVGDTWLEPAEGCRMEDLTVAEYPGMHRYAPVQGLPALLSRLVDRVRTLTGVAEERDNVLVTAGATGGLGAAVGGLVEPGDEVLILAPFWPLIAGIVRSFHGVPVPVPFLGVADSAEVALELVEARRTPRTVALYLNTPNNPSGRLIPRAWVEALVTWAARHDLWVLSDEVYEDYVYEGEHAHARPVAPERTFAAYSFSKAFGMAGNRCGYVVGPANGIEHLRKVSTHTFYSTPTAAQLAAVRVLDGPGAPWVEAARRSYADTGRRAASKLGLPAPAGSTFLFLDVAEHLDERGLGGFLERCVSRGLLLAPGPAFGPYPTHVRLCFTSVAPERALRGVDVLAELLRD